MSKLLHKSLITGLAALLAACASAPSGDRQASPSVDGWSNVPIPGKRATLYSWAEKEGRRAFVAQADSSASLWMKRVPETAAQPQQVEFSWWVQDSLPKSNVGDAERSDSVARVVFGFDGDVGSLPFKTRMLFELAHTLTGYTPPYASLVYVWDAELPIGSVVVDGRSDRIRKIVVDSGPSQRRNWRDHKRDLAADFRLAYGEEPGKLVSYAVMTDTDNTRSRATTWYGEIRLK
jgi:hypothetical protein